MKLALILLLSLIPGLLISQNLSEIKSAVSFIYAKDSTGNLFANGTCFFVNVKSKVKPLFYTYLVTAKHVLKDEKGKMLNFIYLRMNKVDASSDTTIVPLSFNIPFKNVFFHSDPTVDIAVIPFAPYTGGHDFRHLDSTFLFDRNQFKSLPIKEGDETFFTGLFSNYVGVKKIYPIIRFGRIALLPDEKIENKEFILIETNSFGGNSGSPVYFKFLDSNGSNRLILGGVLSGTYMDRSKVEVINTSKQVQVSTHTNGITVIVPVYLLHEILYSDELSTSRDKLIITKNLK